MPNWCQTYITINHEDESKLKELESIISESIREDKNNDERCKNNWLGNIVINTGIGTVNKGLDTDLKCNGNITYMDCIDNQLIIYTETAWDPILKIWVKLLDKYLPDAELVYNAEEIGMQLYVTNDSYLAGKYNINSTLQLMNSKEDTDEKDIVLNVQKLLKSDESNINKLLDEFKESELSNNIKINKWEFRDIDKFD